MTTKPTYEELEQKIAKLEAELKLSPTKFFLERMIDLAYRADDKGNIIYVNPAAKRFTGKDLEEIVGKPFLPLFEEKDHQSLINVYKRTMRGENLENILTFKTGIIAHFTSSPRRDEKGKIVGTFGIAKDITQLKTIEDELKEARDRYKQVTEQSPSVYELYDINGLQIEVNKAYEELWQFPEGRLRTVDKFNVLKSQEVIDTGLINFINKAYSGEIVLLPPYEFDPSGETEAKGVGRKRWLSTKIYPLKDINGKVTNIVITHEDISERVYAEQEQERLREQLIQSQKMDAVGHLAGGVAHDFNNILHGIRSSVDLIEKRQKKDTSSTAHQEKWLTTIKKLSIRGGELTLNLLNFAGQTRFSPHTIDPNFVIKEVVKFLSIGFKPSNHIIKYELNSNQTIYADATQIHQVLQNVLINAKDAMENGGSIKLISSDISLSESITHKFGTIPKGKYVKILIQDTGSGMSEETFEKLFNPFFTTKEKGKGTGLGLSVTYQILKIHNAYYDIETAIGKGTSFSLYFEGKKDAPELDVQLDMDFEGNEKILVVDDEEVIRVSLKSSLQEMDFAVIVAEEGNEAIKLFKKEKPDVVLSDLIMEKGMGGYELFEKIKKIDPAVPFYCMTGYYENTEVEKLKKKGVKGIFQKPFSVYSFLKKMKDDIKQNVK